MTFPYFLEKQCAVRVGQKVEWKNNVDSQSEEQHGSTNVVLVLAPDAV